MEGQGEEAGGEGGQRVDVGDQGWAGGGVEDGVGGEEGGEVEAGWLEEAEGVVVEEGRVLVLGVGGCWEEVGEGLLLVLGFGLLGGKGSSGGGAAAGEEVQRDHEVALVEVCWGAREGERDGDVVWLAAGDALDGGDTEGVGADAGCVR